VYYQTSIASCSGNIMPIIRGTRQCITTYGVLHWLCWLWLCVAGSQTVCSVWKLLFEWNSNFHTVIHGLVLLMMGTMMPETCWGRSLIINIWLVASFWFHSLHPTYFNQVGLLRFIFSGQEKAAVNIYGTF